MKSKGFKWKMFLNENNQRSQIFGFVRNEEVHGCLKKNLIEPVKINLNFNFKPEVNNENNLDYHLCHFKEIQKLIIKKYIKAENSEKPISTHRFIKIYFDKKYNYFR